MVSVVEEVTRYEGAFKSNGKLTKTLHENRAVSYVHSEQDMRFTMSLTYRVIFPEISSLYRKQWHILSMAFQNIR